MAAGWLAGWLVGCSPAACPTTRGWQLGMDSAAPRLALRSLDLSMQQHSVGMGVGWRVLRLEGIDRYCFKWVLWMEDMRFVYKSPLYPPYGRGFVLQARLGRVLISLNNFLILMLIVESGSIRILTAECPPQLPPL